MKKSKSKSKQYELCSKCIHKGFDIKTGIYCKLTNQKPDFEDYCPNFEEDPNLTDKTSPRQRLNPHLLCEDCENFVYDIKTGKRCKLNLIPPKCNSFKPKEGATFKNVEEFYEFFNYLERNVYSFFRQLPTCKVDEDSKIIRFRGKIFSIITLIIFGLLLFVFGVWSIIAMLNENSLSLIPLLVAVFFAVMGGLLFLKAFRNLVFDIKKNMLIESFYIFNKDFIIKKISPISNYKFKLTKVYRNGVYTGTRVSLVDPYTDKEVPVHGYLRHSDAEVMVENLNKLLLLMNLYSYENL